MKKGFTLIELLVVIAIIGLLSSVVLVSVDSARARTRNARRLSDISQITNAFYLYLAGNKDYPAVDQGTYCLGVPSGQTCWDDIKMPGNDSLNTALSAFINIPTDPQPTRGWGDRYLYMDGVTSVTGCNGNTVKGHYILWRPDSPPGSDASCLGKGNFSCCGTGGPCNSPGAYYCAFKLDQ